MFLNHLQLQKKNGELYWVIRTSTNLGNLEFKCWGISQDLDPNKDDRLPHTKDYLKICINNVEDAEAEFAERNSITLCDLSKNKNQKCYFDIINLSQIPEEFRSKLIGKSASKLEIKKAWATIKNKDYWENEENYNFCMNALSKVDKDKLETAPAATSRHHNYAGGLIIHISEVLKNCVSNIAGKSQYSNYINKDVLLCAAIFHDVGKIFTYYCDDVNTPCVSADEFLHGHTFYSMHIFLNISNDLNFENKDFIKEVLHAIAAHHGKLEWNAIAEPKTPEAIILHNSDNESSKLEYIKDLFEKTQPQNDFYGAKNSKEKYYKTYKV
jgi:23S rRNA maturation-related 3'-5' exoribonuclease YhaM